MGKGKKKKKKIQFFQYNKGTNGGWVLRWVRHRRFKWVKVNEVERIPITMMHGMIYPFGRYVRGETHPGYQAGHEGQAGRYIGTMHHISDKKV